MSEYIIEWSGIGARITDLVGSETPCLAVKHLREERLREEIVRCRDCKHMHTVSGWFGTYVDKCYLPDPETGEILDRNIKDLDGFCAWGEKKGSLENGIR